QAKLIDIQSQRFNESNLIWKLDKRVPLLVPLN
uniref:Uncharacterized protein n=1 Tax=Aegilops tauschii subsp. strangulata TaxID=200361 RepID=A0A453MWV7_AEGTS